jgi:hypothetical protein
MDAVDPEVTRILNATSAGDPHAADELQSELIIRNSVRALAR